MLLTSHQVFGHCSKLPKYLLLSRIFLLYSIKSYHHFSFIAEFLNITNFFPTFFVEFKCISEPWLKTIVSSSNSIKYSPIFFLLKLFVYMCMRERERERERRAEAQVVNTYKLMPLESKFVIGVKEKSNGSLNKKIYTKRDLYIIYYA